MQVGLKLNGTHQLLLNADDVIIMGGSVQTIKKNKEVLVVFSMEAGLKANADKTTYVAMSREQNPGKYHNIKMIIFPLKVGKVQIFGNKLNVPKFYSGRK